MKKRGVKVDRNIFKAFDTICEQYAASVSEDNLNKLLKIYERLIPDWVERFNDLSNRLQNREDKKSKTIDDILSAKLPEDYSIKDLKAPRNTKKDISVDIMQRGRIIHLANKIAHQFEYILESNLKAYMSQNGMMTRTPERFREVKRQIRRIYNLNTNAEVRKEAIKVLCERHGFSEEDFVQGKNLDVLSFPRLIKAYSDAMYIKDIEIESVSRLAYNHGKKEISYGLKREKEETLFVMDVQGFGQFSVHVKDPSLISQIRSRYTMPIYKRETAMLVDYKSDKTREFIEDSRTDDSMDIEKGIPRYVSEQEKQRARLREEIKYLNLSKADKHEVAVKGGLHRSDLEEIDNAENER